MVMLIGTLSAYQLHLLNWNTIAHRSRESFLGHVKPVRIPVEAR
jgi:hypothetical protein